MTSRACWGLCLTLVATLVASTTFADARDHFRRGQAAYQQGNYDLAITEWQAGYSLEQRAEFQYNLAQAYERLGRLQEAADAMQRFVASADPDDASYSDAAARLASLQQRLALTGIRIIGGPDGASIFVDEQDWGRLPRPDKISLRPGAHHIEVRLPGHRDFVSNVVIPAGQVVDIEVRMQPLDGSAAGPADTTLPAPGLAVGGSTAVRGRGTSPWLFVGIGAGVATAVGLIGYLITNGDVSNCKKSENFCANLKGVESERTTWGVVTAFGAAATIGSFVLFALDGSNDSERAAATATCTPGLTGASCTLRF